MKRIVLVLCLAHLVGALPLHAQLDGMRVAWPLPKNLNVLGVHRLSGTVNATLTNLNFIQPNLDIENELFLLTLSRSQPILGRSVLWTVALPAGTIETSSTLPLATNDPFVHGVGDPSFGATINLYGAPGLMLREYARYDLATVVSFGINTVFPVGQYDSQEPLNVGGNQWKVRFSLPVVRALGPWVPGSRTTVEVTPSLTWLGDNDDVRDQTVSQDPLVSVEAHLTRDVTRRAALSADYSFIRFGESTTTSNATGAPTGARSAASTHLLGATAHFEINDNLGAYVTHMQTFAEDETPIVLEGALLRITLTWSFHRVIERRRNLGGS